MPDIFISEKKAEKTEKKRNPVHPYSPLSAFCYRPSGIKFVAKDSQEEIILFLRRHWVTNIHWIAISLILLFAPAVLGNFPILAFLPDNFQFIAVAIWYLVGTAYILESFLDWFFNVCIVTDARVFDVDFVNLIYREITDADLDQIQDVTVIMGGAIRTIFNYGDVMIQTAGKVPRIEFTAVPSPDRVAKILRELRIG